MPSNFEHVVDAVYGRPRDGAFFIDVPKLIAHAGGLLSKRADRERLARRAITELRSEGIHGLIVAWVDGPTRGQSVPLL